MRTRWAVTRVRRAVGWLPPDRASRHFLVASTVAASGTGLFLTGSALFFTRTLGLRVEQVGLALSLAGLTGLVCAVPVGRLADRLGPSRTLVGLYLWRAACFVAFPFVGSFVSFVVVACLAGAAEWATAPTVQSVITRLSRPDGRVATMAALTLVRNVGFTVGGGAATVAITVGDGSGYVWVVWANALAFVLAAVLVGRGVVPPAAATRASSASNLRRALPGGRYLVLAGLNGVLYVHALLLAVAFPLWIVSRTAAPVWTVGAVVVLNTLLAVVLQMRLSRGVESCAAAARRQWWSGLVLAATCVVVAVAAEVPPVAAVLLVLLAVTLLTLGEIWQSVGAWGVSFALSDPARRTEQLAVYNLGTTVATIAGPVLLTAVVIPAGWVGWSVLATVLVAAGGASLLVAQGAAAPAVQTRPAEVTAGEP